jgi:hypothetical protein
LIRAHRRGIDAGKIHTYTDRKTSIEIKSCGSCTLPEKWPDKLQRFSPFSAFIALQPFLKMQA